MLFPSKLLSFRESILPKLSELLTLIKNENNISTLKLYNNSKKIFDDIDDFISAIEILYVLEKIEYDEIRRIVKYVENDKK